MSSATPEINPSIKALASAAVSSAKLVGKQSIEFLSDGAFPIGILACMIVLAVAVFIWWMLSLIPIYETPTNIRTIARKSIKDQAYIATIKRKGLREYLNSIQNKINGSELALTNFYVSTVNATGFFFPAKHGVFTPEAARLAVLGGARAFVFDIWPDLTPGAEFGPILQVVEEGSLWRRISINSLNVSVVLQALIQEAFEIPERPGSGDPVYFYLRFRGKPRRRTLDGTADALRATMESYRLPPAYYNRNKQDGIFSTPITEFFKKVIICSNNNAQGSRLSDFINVGVKDGYTLEWDPRQAKGLTVDGRASEAPKIQASLTWVAPNSETPTAENNNYDFKASWDVGIHFCAVNFWNNNDKLKEYMTTPMFGVYSFALKPEPLRYKILLLDASKFPQNPGWGSGVTAGSPKVPQSIQLP